MNTDPKTTLEESAGDWVLRRNSGAWGVREQRELNVWLATSEAHRRAYMRAQKFWLELDRLKTVSFPARQAAHSRRVRYKQRKRAQAVVGAAALAVLLTVGINDQLLTSGTNYRTVKGEQLSVTLGDGSQVNINTDTELQVSLSENVRRVRLYHGEAYFSVAHDAAKPFEVTTRGGVIHDVGTRFNVYAEADYTQVGVTDGEVDVITNKPGVVSRWLGKFSVGGWGGRIVQTLSVVGVEKNAPLRLVAGQQFDYSDLGGLSAVSKKEAERMTAWLKGRVNFELASLDEVVQQLSRYYPVEFQFTDKNLQQLKVTGSFEVANLPLLLNTLERALPIAVERKDQQHILIMPAQR